MYLRMVMVMVMVMLVTVLYLMFPGLGGSNLLHTSYFISYFILHSFVVL